MTDDNTMDNTEGMDQAATTSKSTEVTLGKGLDIGTANLAAAVQNDGRTASPSPSSATRSSTSAAMSTPRTC